MKPEHSAGHAEISSESLEETCEIYRVFFSGEKSGQQEQEFCFDYS